MTEYMRSRVLLKATNGFMNLAERLARSKSEEKSFELCRKAYQLKCLADEFILRGLPTGTNTTEIMTRISRLTGLR